LSFNELKDFTPGGRNIFDWSEYISANVLLPLGGFLVAVFVGWRVSRMTIASEFGANGAKLFNSWLFLLKYCAPIAVAIVFLNSSGLDLLFS
jgi:NSS family neurotransmitter:Na+ symporter